MPTILTTVVKPKTGSAVHQLQADDKRHGAIVRELLCLGGSLRDSEEWPK